MLISIFISIKCTDWREKIQFQASYWSAGDSWEEPEESYNPLCALCCPPCMTKSYRVGMRYFYKKGPLAGAMFVDWPVFVRIYLVPSCWRGRILDQDCLEESVAFSTRFLSLQSDPSKQSKQAFSLNPNSWQGCSRKTISEGRDLCPVSSGQVFKLKRLLFHSSPAINYMGHELRRPGWIRSVLSAAQHPCQGESHPNDVSSGWNINVPRPVSIIF